ncbi:MAG: DUF4149 domain-containing protein [Alphaproteobacteria bacterium]|nr:MAG: DUF4149 domain-containing protein [Alphaproteobacteria bacterium]
MKTLKSILVEMILPFIVAWFFMTVLVDIVAVPTVFRNISNLEEGGKIGLTIFGAFNRIEIFLGLVILFGTISMKEKSKLMISGAVVLLVFSLFYTFFMTPMIGDTSIQIHLTAVTDPQYEILKKQHRTYHELYRYFDTTKLFILLGFAAILTRFNIKRMHKECV